MRHASKLAVLPPAPPPPGEGAPLPWHTKPLELARELAGLPTLVTVVASFFTESQRVLAIWALCALLIAVALRFLPSISKAKSISLVLPWLVTALLAMTLVLVLVVVPYRAEKQKTLLAKSWLDWQTSLELSAAKCRKSTTPESCLSTELADVLENRPKSAHAAAKLASAMIAGQVLLANQTIHEVLQKRLSVDERFIGAGNSEPIQHNNATAAMVPEYFVPNLRNEAPYVWVWELNLGLPLNGSPLVDQKLMDVLLKVPAHPRPDGQDFAQNWTDWIEDKHLVSSDVPALIRFAVLDPTNTHNDKGRQPMPSGCLGRPDATRVFMNRLGVVKDETLATAIKDSGYTLRPDDPDARLFIWIYVPTQTGEVTRATWENVLVNLTTWIVENPCAAKPKS
jgi:hypothetical protein